MRSQWLYHSLLWWEWPRCCEDSPYMTNRAKTILSCQAKRNLLLYRMLAMSLSSVSSSSLSVWSSLSTISVLVDRINALCSSLVNALSYSFDKVSIYGISAVQGLVSWSKHLFADWMVRQLQKINTLIDELSTHSEAKTEDTKNLLNLWTIEFQTKVASDSYVAREYGWLIEQIIQKMTRIAYC